MFVYISEISILVSAVLAVAVGSVWFSPLLFDMSYTESQRQDTLDQKQFVARIIGEVLVFVVLYGVLAQCMHSVYQKVSVFESASLLTLLVSIYTIIEGIQENRSLKHVLVRVGYTAIVFFGGFSVMIYWPW
jgi:hypothetical protein